MREWLVDAYREPRRWVRTSDARLRVVAPTRELAIAEAERQWTLDGRVFVDFVVWEIR